MIRKLFGTAIKGAYHDSLMEEKCGSSTFRILFYWLYVLTDKRVFGVDTYLVTNAIDYLICTLVGYNVNPIPESPLEWGIAGGLIFAFHQGGYLLGIFVGFFIPYLTGWKYGWESELIVGCSQMIAVYVLGLVKRGNALRVIQRKKEVR